MSLLGIVGRLGVSWGVLGCPVIKLTGIKISSRVLFLLDTGV